MANVTQDFRGVVIELDHQETQQMLNGAPGVSGGVSGAITGILVAAGVGGPLVAIIAAAVAAHFAWEGALIKAMDQGEGVILTMPWLTPGVVIPSSRHPVGLPPDWATRNEGTLTGAGGDTVQYHIDRAAGDPNVVVFRLRNECQSGWDKAFVLRDGQGGEWVVLAHGFSQAENGLYANQVHNGQSFTFRKPGFLGVWHDVFSIGGLDPLNGGGVVTYIWIRD
jgi:hypothetical protein